MLKVQGLKFAYKNRPLFENLSFEVGDRSLIRIAGANGSGKSTLVSLITDLISGAQGKIIFDGPNDYRSWTSWIAADANGLIPSLSATANLEFWLRLRGRNLPNEVLESALSDWGLSGVWVQKNLPVSRFSTGMRRRLALARLDLEASRLWILDEPLFGLDDAACQKFRNNLERHIATGGAAIVVTHDERLMIGLDHETIKLGRQGN